MKRTLGAAALCCLAACGGGGSATAPTPTPAVNPLVTIQMTYDCSPCNNDPDNYQINVDCGVNGCHSIASVANPLLDHNTVTWTGRLAPGSHTFEMRVHNVPIGKAAIITFPPAGSDNNGGVRPNSLEVASLESAG